MKVFLGTIENCGILNGIAVGFQKLGHEVTTYVEARDNFFPNYRYDFELSKLGRTVTKFKSIPFLRGVEYRYNNYTAQKQVRKIFFRDWLDFDLYVFTWKSILPNLEDLRILSKRGKKIVFVFIGSEARYFSSFNQQYPDTGIVWPAPFLMEDLGKKLKFIRTVELLANSIHALPDLAGLFIRSYHPTYVPYILDDSQILQRENEIPIVLHAPSNRDLKGTSKIAEAVTRLKAAGLNFHFEILEKLPNTEVIKKLRKADIAVDQIFLHYPGIFSTEAMANGCAVASRIFENDDDTFFNPPICNINQYNIYDQLKKLIEDREYRQNLASAGRDFVHKYNSPESVAQQIINGLDPENPAFFKPTFFCERFHLDENIAIDDEVKFLNKQLVHRVYTKEASDMVDIELRKRGLA